ncbi:MAG TPA: ABC transporter permease [Blastocatellia bacterium]|nr:ABC transporter permease [Blastocatellia bacterium]
MRNNERSQFRPHRRVIHLIGVIVPRRLRANWRQEWEAELRHREAMLAEWDRLDRGAKLDLLWRSTSAFWDALWLQPKRLEDEMFQDLRFGVRMLVKNPGFTTVAVLTLALGIGANTAIFGVVNAALLRSLPCKEPARLVTVWESNAAKGQTHGFVGGANFTDWKNQNQVFESLAAYMSWNYNLTGDDEPRRLTAAVVSAGFFQTLGAEAALGRALLPEDDQEVNENVVVLSYALWQSRFGADREIIGRTITLNGRPHTVVGVMPAGFDFPDDQTEIWRPMAMSPQAAQNREGKWLKVVGRLKPGVSLEQASAAMNTIAGRLGESYPQTNAGWGVNLIPLREELVGKVSLFLLTLFGAVLFVLLIACVNVANLLLARAATRRKENAIRAALGAGRLRLLRQFLTENLLLAALGGGLGLALAFCSLDALIALSPDNVPGLAKATIDGRVLGFTLALSLLTTLLFGLVPAWQASKPDLNDTLKEGGHRTTGGAGRRAHNALVVAEVAASVVLLVGAGLMIRSFIRLQAVEPGFNSNNVLTMKIMLPPNKYGENHQSIAFFRQALERIKTIPGVVSAGAVQDLPLYQNTMNYAFSIEGRPDAPAASRPEAAYRAVTEDYFRTMGIPLLQGRAFTADDNLQTEPVVIINQTMARRFWPDEDPLGKGIRFGEPNDPACTVIGVVGDVKHLGLADDEVAAIYQPHAQKRFAWLRWMTIVVRAKAAPLSLIAPIRSRIAEVDRAQPVYDIATMEQLLTKSITQPRFSTFLFGLFALLALTLVAVGLYGVMSYAVAQRAHEIGLRIALGAKMRDVLTLVIGRGMKLTLLGIAIGLTGAIALTGVLKTLLFNVGATDPLTFAGVAALLLVVALLACYLPARRATKVDPMTALRNQ